MLVLAFTIAVITYWILRRVQYTASHNDDVFKSGRTSSSIGVKLRIYSTMIPFIPRCRNTLKPRQNGRRFADDVFKCIFLNENIWISIKISLKFVPKSPVNNIPALVQIMAWRRPGDKPLSEAMMASLLTHICITRPQWINFCDARDGMFRFILSIQCLLMPWLHKSPGHQPQWYWQYWIGKMFGCSDANLAFFCCTNSKMWYEMWVQLS